MHSKIVLFDIANVPEIIRIRTSVFVKEKNIDAGLDFDSPDEPAKYVLVLLNSGTVGTARLLEDGHIGRLVVI